MIGSSIVRVVIKSVNNGNIFRAKIHNCNCKDNEMFVSSILHVTNIFASHQTSHQDLSNCRPQTKFAKVMFSQVSVCPQVGCLPLSGPGGRGRHPSGLTQVQGTPPTHRNPWGRDPQGRHPPTPGQTVNKRAVRILVECNLVYTSSRVIIALFTHNEI